MVALSMYSLSVAASTAQFLPLRWLVEGHR